MSDDINARIDRIENAICYMATAVLRGADVDAFNKHLNSHIKPIDEPSPAQRLVDIANSLPQEVLGGLRGFRVKADGDNGNEWIVWQDPELFCESMSRPSGFRRTLLGVMSAFVGTEVRAVVMRIGGNRAQYRGGQDSHYIEVDGPDAWLIVHRDCCLSIAEKRRKA